MTVLSRRLAPAAYVLCIALSGCAQIESSADDAGSPDAGPGGTTDGGPSAPDAGTGPGWPDGAPPLPAATAFAPVYLVTDSNQLVLVGAEAPSTVLSSLDITGLSLGETVLGIDFRPATGGLYALGSSNRVYLIDTVTGAATRVGDAPFGPAFTGTSFGVDFNPTVDRIRVVTDAENLRLHPVTGAVAGTDTPLAYDPLDPGAGATARVVGSAYTANFLGSTRTTLYGIDVGRDALVRQGSEGGSPVSPNTGTLFTVGSLGLDAGSLVGFDIATSDAAFAALAPAAGGPVQLHIVNLATGAATPIGPLGDGSNVVAMAIPTPTPPTVYGLTETNKLIGFRADAPGAIVGWVQIVGLAVADEQLLGIDFRPATGELYALGSTSRLYKVDIASGAAAAVGAGPFTPALDGTSFGFDFNPTVDRIRVVSDATQNMRLNPNTGAVAGADVPLWYSPGDPGGTAAPRVAGSAYTANFLGSTRTTLLGIDTVRDTLVRQGSVGGAPNSPNFGALFTIGALGIDASNLVGFDIATADAAFAALNLEGDAATSSLYVVNLASGAVTSLGAIGGGERLRGIAIQPPASPTVYAATESNQLLTFLASAPGSILGQLPIVGLAPGEKIHGLDVRPATGELYALGSTSQLYVIDPDSGAATAVGGPFSPLLGGKAFGFDFNPTVDRIRVVSGRAENIRLHPVTGAVAGTDTDLAYDAADPNAGSPPRGVGAAYTGSFLGSTRTTLYDIDAEKDTLVRQGSDGGSPVSPNLGTLFTVGSLGVNASDLVGFDIATTGAAFTVLVPAANGAAQVYIVNLATGALTSIGAVGSADTIAAAALVP